MLRKDLEFSWFNPPHVFLFVCLSFYSWLVPWFTLVTTHDGKSLAMSPKQTETFNKGTEQTLISSDFSGWTIYGCFLKMMVPPFHTPKWSFLVGKPMNVGETHHFRKHPDCGFHLFFCDVASNERFLKDGEKSRSRNQRFQGYSPYIHSWPCTKQLDMMNKHRL